jgi:hypothetical protein
MRHFLPPVNKKGPPSRELRLATLLVLRVSLSGLVGVAEPRFVYVNLRASRRLNANVHRALSWCRVPFSFCVHSQDDDLCRTVHVDYIISTNPTIKHFSLTPWDVLCTATFRYRNFY